MKLHLYIGKFWLKVDFWDVNGFDLCARRTPHPQKIIILFVDTFISNKAINNVISLHFRSHLRVLKKH